MKIRMISALSLSLLVFAGCELFAPPVKEDKKVSVSPAAAVAPAALAASGATTNPDSLEKVAALTMGVAMDQSEVQTLQTMAADMASAVNPSNPAGLTRTLSTAAQAKIDEIETAMKDFPVKKSLAVSADFSAEDFGQYLEVTAARASVTAAAVTTDGAAIADNGSNLQSVSGEFTATLSANLTGIPAASAIKAAVLNANVAAKGSASSKLVGTTRVPDVVSAEYAASVSIGLSVNKNGTGGKIVLKADASGSGTVSDYKKFENPDFYQDFNPNVTFTLTVYKDDGSKAFEKVWNSLEALIEEIETLLTPKPAKVSKMVLTSVVPSQTYFLVGAETAITYADGTAFMAGGWGVAAAWDNTVTDRTFTTDASGTVTKTFSQPVVLGEGGYKWTEGSGWAMEIGPNDNGGGDFNATSVPLNLNTIYTLTFTGSGDVAKNKATVSAQAD